MLQQLRDPFAIFYVRLPARHVLDVLRVHQQQLKAILQKVPNRLPVNTRRLHGHLWTPNPSSQSANSCIWTVAVPKRLTVLCRFAPSITSTHAVTDAL